MRRAAEGREKETDRGRGRKGTRAALPGFGDGDPGGRGPAAAATDRKGLAGGSCASAASGAAATAPRAAQSLALALASWRWVCRRCGGCCFACYCRGRGCYTETPAFGAFAIPHTRSHPRGPGERHPRDIGIEINNKVQRVREEGLIDVEGLAGVSHSPAPRGGVRERRRSSSAAPWPRPLGGALVLVRVRVKRPGSLLFSLLLVLFSYSLFSSLVSSRAGKAGRVLKTHIHKSMAGRRLANPPLPVLVRGLGAFYSTFAKGGLTAKPSADLGG